MQSRLIYRPGQHAQHAQTVQQDAQPVPNKRTQYRTPKSPEGTSHKLSIPSTSEVISTKQDRTFANLLLPSIPTTLQRSSKQIKNHTPCFVEKQSVPREREADLIHHLHQPPHKLYSAVGANLGPSAPTESPVLSSYKFPPDRSLTFNNGRPDSFRIRQTNPSMVMSMQ